MVFKVLFVCFVVRSARSDYDVVLITNFSIGNMYVKVDKGIVPVWACCSNSADSLIQGWVPTVRHFFGNIIQTLRSTAYSETSVWLFSPA